jgi:hypothetical protein
MNEAFSARNIDRGLDHAEAKGLTAGEANNTPTA